MSRAMYQRYRPSTVTHSDISRRERRECEATSSSASIAAIVCCRVLVARPVKSLSLLALAEKVSTLAAASCMQTRSNTLDEQTCILYIVHTKARAGAILHKMGILRILFN